MNAPQQWPVGAKIALVALVLTAVLEVVALTAYVAADAQRQMTLEDAFNRHVRISEAEVIPQLAQIRVELRALNVRLDYLEAQLQRHDTNDR